MNPRFEWNPRKAAANREKHGVSFEEALTVFSDRLARVFGDEAYSDEEAREVIVGHSARRRLLIVCFTERQSSIRIFSARKATKRERQDYEENIEP